MGTGSKRLLTRIVHQLGHRQERYGFILPEAPIVKSVVLLNWPWRQSCLDGWAQSDDQLQREPENLFVGGLLSYLEASFGFVSDPRAETLESPRAALFHST